MNTGVPLLVLYPNDRNLYGSLNECEFQVHRASKNEWVMYCTQKPKRTSMSFIRLNSPFKHYRTKFGLGYLDILEQEGNAEETYLLSIIGPIDQLTLWVDESSWLGDKGLIWVTCPTWSITPNDKVRVGLNDEYTDSIFLFQGQFSLVSVSPHILCVQMGLNYLYLEEQESDEKKTYSLTYRSK